MSCLMKNQFVTCFVRIINELCCYVFNLEKLLILMCCEVMLSCVITQLNA